MEFDSAKPLPEKNAVHNIPADFAPFISDYVVLRYWYLGLLSPIYMSKSRRQWGSIANPVFTSAR
jgi:hypothetical protein